MHPVLIDFGPFALHSYGLAMAVAFAVGIWVATIRAKAKGFGPYFAIDISILILIFSMIGARATYVLTHLDEYREYPFDAISPIQHTGKIGIEGLVLLGGVAAAFLTVYIYSRRKGHHFLSVTDLLIPPTALGIAVGRIGCFFNGCCFGLPTHQPWCVHFPKGSLAAYIFPHECIHPTQIYETGYALVIFAGLMLYDRRPRPTGVVTGLFLLLYGIGRYFNEQLRWYEHEMVLIQTSGFRLTFSQVISIAMILLGILLLLTVRRRTSPKEEPAP
ncbi:prolipoprotein diacylglyceryl transferase [bacterium]|nr:prolipoprotein diacylglyceryl transferase [bacterium]MBU1984452.1 prolipoprotein diacylglyceryl transferase [bacterium]